MGRSRPQKSRFGQPQLHGPSGDCPFISHLELHQGLPTSQHACLQTALVGHQFRQQLIHIHPHGQGGLHPFGGTHRQAEVVIAPLVIWHGDRIIEAELLVTRQIHFG